MSTRAIGLFVVASIAACGGADPAPVAVARPPANATPSVAPLEPRRVTVAVDTPMTTASGSTFVAPKGWTVITSVDGVVLEAPDQDASVTFVERREADGAAAIAAAWRTLRFDSHLTPEKITTWPGRGGWDASTFVDYPEGPGTDRFAALARRKGDVWFVTLTAGHVASLGDRRAELRVARNGFRAKGVVDESFRDMKGHVLDAARLAKLEAFVEEGRRAFQIPGVAVAVVQGGKIAFAKGFGVKALGKPAPVTADTLFRVASTTKPLTSAMIAALVGEGRFSWDTRVTELYPGFAVADAELTKRLTMRDMLCGCTGIPYDDLGTGFAYVGVTGEQVLARMHGLAPTAGFRERFQYANTMVAAAGYIAAHARYPKLSLGDAYDRAMRDELFGPLGMRATTFDSKAAL
ncbi:MAG TPA: serine hydrolase domain-containing protein, partial [Byssovorax sp.]